MSNNTHRGYSRSGRVLVQMAVIIAIGFVIGLTDAFVLRPIDLSPRQETKTVEQILAEKAAQRGSSPGATTTNSSPTNPTTPTPSTPNNSTSTPTTAPIATPTAVPAAPASTSGNEPFKFTPKDQLPKGQITVDEAKSLFDAGATFVDARKVEDFEKGHVRDAFRLTADMFKAGDPAELALIPRASVVVVYCNGGHCDESENVAKMMDNSGYKAGVFVVHDGFPGWQAAGHPISEGKPHYE